jgi:endonuclease/exonuclease/phosphatase family metal-dependent hydrolase
MAHTLCTFNVNNLFARYRFGSVYPGDRSGRSRIENAGSGYLPVYDNDLIELFNEAQREMAARAIRRDGTRVPDILCLQEVESLLALRKFNEVYLGGAYQSALLVDSRDFRQIDVAVLTNLEIVSVRSHVDDVDPQADDPKQPFLFSRDCLEVTVALNRSGTQTVTLLLNHLKSKLSDSQQEREKADARRKRQASAIVRILKERFPGNDYTRSWFAVLGDLNDEPRSQALAPLFDAQSGLIDALARIANEEDRWTHWWKSENAVSQLDHLLLSPALAAATQGSAPEIFRDGIGFARVLADGGPGPRKTRFHRFDDDPDPIELDFRFKRLSGVTTEDYASDHCPVFLELP